MPKTKSSEPSQQSESLPSKVSKIFGSYISRITSLVQKESAIDKKAHAAIKNLNSRFNDISSKEKSILSNFMSFCDKTAEDVMIPRSDIFAISSTTDIGELNEKLLGRSHTRTLVYEDNLDNIIGFIHIKDLFKDMVSKRTFDAKKIMRHPIVAAPSMKLIDLLTEMQRTRTHIAIVVDEYGGTDGIATIEDIIEALVGKIEDEHDAKDDPKYKIIKTGREVIADARMEIEEIENLLNIRIKDEDDECDTIGGLILGRIGHVPQKGTTIPISDSLSAHVLESGPRNLKKIRLIVSDPSI